jgi:hypothetical protein
LDEVREVVFSRITATLGHSEIKTTGGYTHVKDEVLRHQLNELGEKQPFNHYTIFPPTAETMKKDSQENPASPFLPGIKWSGRDDLNIRPHGPEPCALPG